MAGARGSARRELVGRLLQGRNRRRAPGARGRLHVVLRWIAGGLALGTLAVALPPLAGALRRHPYFALREVVVRADHRLAAAEVRRLAGIELGTSVWDFDPIATAERLAAHPWVHAAEVEREPPARVVIRVREERPAAILALASSSELYYVARNARVLGRVGAKDSRDFPFVTGLRAADLRPGEDFGPYALGRALALLRAAARVRGLEPVSEVHVDRKRGLSLLLLRPAAPIEVGWEGFASRLALLPRVLTLWAGREGDMAGMSVRFADQVVVRTRAGASLARAQKVGRS